MLRYHLLLALIALSFISADAQQPVVQWQHCYGGTDFDKITSIQPDVDGGYILSGTSASANGDLVNQNYQNITYYWLVKIDNNGNIVWNQTYGGSVGEDGVYAIPADGGYAIIGTTYSSDGDVTNYKGGIGDVWLVKTDMAGNLLWERTYGGNGFDFADAMQKTPDGYIIAAETDSASGDVTFCHGGIDIWIIKTDDTGGIVWQKSLGGSAYDFVYSVITTSDGGYMVAGSTQSTDGDIIYNNGGEDAWIIKLNGMGEIMWQKTYGGSGYDVAQSVILTHDGGYIFAAYTNSIDGDVTSPYGGTSDYWVVKIDSTGAIQWEKTYGGSGDDYASSIQQTLDGGYVVLGSTTSTDGQVTGLHSADSSDYWVIKLDDTGALLWQKTLGGTNSESAYNIIETPDGNYIAAGQTASHNGDVSGYHGGNYDGWVVQLGEHYLATPSITNKRPVKVYPTLTNGPIHIDMPAGYETSRIEAYNMLGNQIALDVTSGKSNGIIQLSNVPAGMYIIKVICDGQATNYKVVYQP